MIDDYEQTMELVHEMGVQLPISARPTSNMIRGLRNQGHKITRDQRLVIQSVFYAGDEGGIVCALRKLDRYARSVLETSA